MKITYELTRSDLEAHGACPEGLQTFDGIATSGTVKIEWNQFAEISLRSRFPAFSQWLRDKRLVPAVSLQGADLRGADLWGADLRGANLQSANLQSADLRGADLWGADLRGADLRGANLWGADLYGADLRYANLRDADLRVTNLRGAVGANLDGAII